MTAATKPKIGAIAPWTWHRFEGRSQANQATPEVLIVNQRSRDDVAVNT